MRPITEEEKMLLEHHIPDTFFALITALVEESHKNMLAEFKSDHFVAEYRCAWQKLEKKMRDHLYTSHIVFSWLNLKEYVDGKPAMHPVDAYTEVGRILAAYYLEVQQLCKRYAGHETAEQAGKESPIPKKDEQKIVPEKPLKAEGANTRENIGPGESIGWLRRAKQFYMAHPILVGELSDIKLKYNKLIRPSSQFNLLTQKVKMQATLFFNTKMFGFEGYYSSLAVLANLESNDLSERIKEELANYVLELLNIYEQCHGLFSSVQKVKNHQQLKDLLLLLKDVSQLVDGYLERRDYHISPIANGEEGHLNMKDPAIEGTEISFGLYFKDSQENFPVQKR